MSLEKIPRTELKNISGFSRLSGLIVKEILRNLAELSALIKLDCGRCQGYVIVGHNLQQLHD